MGVRAYVYIYIFKDQTRSTCKIQFYINPMHLSAKIVIILMKIPYK